MTDIETKVQESITKSTEHINSQIEDIKNKVEESVTQIDQNITQVDGNLRKYIDEELERIVREFKDKVNSKFTEFHQSLSSHIGFINQNRGRSPVSVDVNLYSISGMITLLNRNSYFGSQNIEPINVGKITGNVTKINRALTKIKQLIVQFDKDKIESLVTKNTQLTYDDLGNDQQIVNTLTQYIDELSSKKEEIKNNKKIIQDAFTEIKKEVGKLDDLDKVKQKSRESYGLPFLSTYINTVKKNLTTNLEKVQTLLQNLDSPMTKLYKQVETLRQDLETLNPKPKGFREVFTSGFKSFLSWINPFTFESSHSEQPNELQNIGKQIQKLKHIRDLNEGLKGYTNQSRGVNGQTPVLKSIKEYVNNLNYQDNNLKKVETGINEFGRSDYYTHISKIKSSVNKLLIRPEIQSSDKPGQNGESGKPLLKTVNQSLTEINTQLEELDKHGKNIQNLDKMRQAIKDLESIKSEIETVKPSQQSLDSTFDRLKRAKDTFMSGLGTIKSIGSLILDLVSENRQKLERLNKMEQTVEWLRDKHHKIDKMTTSLNSLVSSEISKKEDTLITSLKEFDGKLDKGIKEKLSTIMSKLQDYSSQYKLINSKSNSEPGRQDGTLNSGEPVEGRQGGSSEVTKEIQDIKTIIKDNIQSKIPEVKTNIKYIMANDVTSKYQEYSLRFAEFREQIDKLYHCVDYVVRDFLSCSLDSIGDNLGKIQYLK